MIHLKIYEDFEEFKGPSPIQKAFKAGKQFFGLESDKDRETLESIYRFIDNKSGEGHNIKYVENIREIKPGVIVAHILNKSLLVDRNTPEIIYGGKELELKDLDLEANSLFVILNNMRLS